MTRVRLVKSDLGSGLRPKVGRRDVSFPAASRRRQKDSRLTWDLKDEVMRRGRVYCAKLAGGRSMLEPETGSGSRDDPISETPVSEFFTFSFLPLQLSPVNDGHVAFVDSGE
jgi:hypothetical protein